MTGGEIVRWERARLLHLTYLPFPPPVLPVRAVDCSRGQGDETSVGVTPVGN